MPHWASPELKILTFDARVYAPLRIETERHSVVTLCVLHRRIDSIIRAALIDACTVIHTMLAPLPVCSRLSSL